MIATAARTGELAQLVAIDEGIKRVARASGRMRLEATNAIILTHKNGASVPGFDAVARQMGELSRELAACVVRLRASSLTWIRALSAQVGLAREIEVIAAAEAAAPGHAREVLARLRARAAAAPEVTACERAFALGLGEARRLVATGWLLSRAAKQEAAYGGALAATLAENAHAFTALATGVRDAVHDITQRAVRLGAQS